MNRVLQMAARADIREKIPQAPFAQGIDVELERLTEPRNTDDLAPRAHRLDRLHHCFVSGKALLRAAPGAFEDDVGPVASRQVANGGNDIDRGGVEGMIGPQFL